MNTLSKRKYHSHKWNAFKRNVEFNLTYDEWYDIWIKSGKAHLRGSGKGTYCMARHNDEGPYAVGNVSIVTNKQNSTEGATRRDHAHWLSSIIKARHDKVWRKKISQEGNNQYKGIIVGTNIMTGEQIILKGKNEINAAGFAHQHVYKCVNGKLKTHKGHTWQRIPIK